MLFQCFVAMFHVPLLTHLLHASEGFLDHLLLPLHCLIEVVAFLDGADFVVTEETLVMAGQNIQVNVILNNAMDHSVRSLSGKSEVQSMLAVDKDYGSL